MQKTIASAIGFIVFIAKTSTSRSGRQIQQLLRVIDHDGADYITATEE